MRKLALLTLFIALSCGLLAGCGKRPSTLDVAPPPVTQQ